MVSPALSPDDVQRLHEALGALQSTSGDAAIDARALVAAGATALELGRWDDVLALARAALVIDPQSARAWSLAGGALAQQGKLHEARAAFESAVSFDDRDLAAAISAAELQVKTGNASGGRALANYVLLREQGAPAIRARAQALLEHTPARAAR